MPLSACADRFTLEVTHPHYEIERAPLQTLLREVAANEPASIHHVTVILADRDTVLELNRRYLEHDYPTDVLSFPLHDGPNADVEGEIYVDLDTAAERHNEFDTSFEAEVHRYVVHGLLHLLGYDDKSSAEQTAMRARENHHLDRATR